MKLLHFLLLAVACLSAVYAWDKEDHEIFDQVAALEKAEGKGTTFYSFLDVPSTASTKQIDKAFKKASMQYHPDKTRSAKNRDVLDAKYARMSVIAGILRREEDRKRYDFFYKNGVPKWKGTGYFYSRWRPGFGTVVVFLALLTAAFQLLFQTLNHRRDVDRLSAVLASATKAAASVGPGREGRRKVKIEVGGAIRECAVDADGEVYLLDPAHEPYHLSLESLPAPSVRSTWLVLLGQSLLAKAGLGAQHAVEQAEEVVEEVQEEAAKASGRAKKEAARRR